MKELPSFVKPERSDKEVLRVPSQYHPSPIIMDTANIQALMSTPIKVTLTLAKILKVKPKLWHEVRLCLENMGVLVSKFKPIQVPKEMVGKVKCKPIPSTKSKIIVKGKTTIPLYLLSSIKCKV